MRRILISWIVLGTLWGIIFLFFTKVLHRLPLPDLDTAEYNWVFGWGLAFLLGPFIAGIFPERWDDWD